MVSVAQQRQGGDWVDSGSTRINVHSQTTLMCQTKLLFNEAIPASTSNRATHVGPPAAIVIEKLLPPPEDRENVASPRSSVSFTSLSEERLQAAVKLAKRDLKRRHRELGSRSSIKPSQEDFFSKTSDVELIQLATDLRKAKLTSSSQETKATQHGTRQSECAPKKRPIFPRPGLSRTPLTRPLPAPRPVKGGDQQVMFSQEICKLQNELDKYIQKVEQFANKGKKVEESLEPEELKKLEVRRQKQATLSARSVYVLQQQVKEIQEDIQKLHSQKMPDIKKATAINKLAAAHRGTLRALQLVSHQLSDLSHSKFPDHFKKLSQVIRQLSLCSAKLEVEQGSSVPETALSILQKLETLDSAISKQELLHPKQVQPDLSHMSMSPTNAPKGPDSSTARGNRSPKRNISGRKMASHKPRMTSLQPIRRGRVLRTGPERRIQQRELRDPQHADADVRKEGMRHCERSKADFMIRDNRMQDASRCFQQPTVSSRFKVNQPPQKEPTVPWMPTSPHSLRTQSKIFPQRTSSEHHCLGSPVKSSPSVLKQTLPGASADGLVLSSDKKKQAQNEAIRNAWLDKMTKQRIQELNQLSREEAERIQRLRSTVVSPSQWAERAEQKAREKIQPLLDEAQHIKESGNRFSSSLTNRLPEQDAERAAESAEQLSEALLEDLLEDTARAMWATETDRQLEGIAQQRLQAPTLESMLLRMEEIQKDEEEVRRRIASITYSDPLYWDRPGPSGHQHHVAGAQPASPQPIRLIKPVLSQSTAADIILEKPVEMGILLENSLSENAAQEEQQPRSISVFPGPVERSTGTVLSVPGSTLRSIRQYREDYESHLRFAAQDAVGGFSSWTVVDSLAEEFLSEAVADVAAEFQDVVEEYAEAVFTSEFLQPIQSPAASAPPDRVFQL